MLEKELESRIQSAFNIPDVGKDLNFTCRRREINWIKVVSADIKKIINEKDFQSLKENVWNIIHYDLDSAVSPEVLDPRFVKLFRLSQLTIEYLLHVLLYFQKRSKQLFDERLFLRQELGKSVKGRQERSTDLNGTSSSFNLNETKKDSHIVFVGNDSSNVFRCMLCGKIFLNGCYLYAHHQRRHSQSDHPSSVRVANTAANFSSKSPEKSNKISEGEAEKIWKELEWLRKKVNQSYSSQPFHQDISEKEAEFSITPNQSFQGRRSNPVTPEKSNDGAVSVKVNMRAAVMGSYSLGNQKSIGEIVEKDSNDSKILEDMAKEEGNMEDYLYQELKNDPNELAKNNVQRKTMVSAGTSPMAHPQPLHEDDEQMKSNAMEVAAKEDDGRLEAQERAWRGRHKAMEDNYLQQIEALRKEISFWKERESKNEESYSEKIKKLTKELKAQAVKSTSDQAVGTISEEELVQSVPPIPSIAEDPESPRSSEDDTITSLSPVKEPVNRESPLVTPVSNESEVRSGNSDSESESTDVSSSPNVLRKNQSEHSPEEEESSSSDSDMAADVFEKKLRRLNINPTAKSMPEKVFKEKMEMLNAERRLLKRKIENYHHIKSNLEEKADARVSQRVLRSKLDKPQAVEESNASSSSHKSPKDSSSTDKSKDFSSNVSSKESSLATTSRSSQSSSSHLTSGRTLTSHSSIKSKDQKLEDAFPSQSRIAVMAERWKGNKGAGTSKSDFHSKIIDGQTVAGVSTLRSSTAIGESHSHTSVGASILRGLRHNRDGERAAPMPSLGGFGSKSVSFAHDLIGGKVYHAV
ncbi:zinc finger protein DZIP1-like isoform X2 [Ischnura elegans]|uniref:zinc finger protein DZIP1-like isoform X2 n=1 Tax=Ischnura elegans TaxID=197161 RepID=UPI001ED8BD3E|nr:zinc finger protein DZIP1-like isoform X2 [Ischnura elegans]